MSTKYSQDNTRTHRSHRQQVSKSTNSPSTRAATTAVKQSHIESRPKRNAEQQLKLERRLAIKASFGSKASQLKLAVYLILVVALILTGIAFFTSNWLEVERRFYGSKFKRLGLWRMCFNSYSAPDDFQFKKFFVGCRWIFADEYKPIRRFLLTGLLTFQLTF